MRNIGRCLWSCLVACACLNACGNVQQLAPVRDVKQLKGDLPSFYFWRKEPRSKQWTNHLLDPRGQEKVLRRSHEKPGFSLEDASKGLFWPDARYSSKILEESGEVPSPDGKWAIKTYGIKTFADDLNNAFLVVIDKGKGSAEKVKVPANSMGTLWPLFWHPTSRYFYFMAMMGAVSSRTFGLWQYDLHGRRFCNIGETDGRAFLSPDGDWILWETGRLMDECGPPPAGRCIHLMAYHIPEDVNYRITSKVSMDLFHGWKK